MLLLHNEDDLKALPQIMPLLSYLDIFRSEWTLAGYSLSTASSSLTIVVDCSVKVPVAVTRELPLCRLSIRANRCLLYTSIAEAALALNDIFKAADQAASQYIESIKRMEHEKNVEFQALRQKTLDACAVMREDTQEYCRRLRYESEAKRDALYAQLEKEEIEKNNSSEGSDPSTWTRLETSPSVGGGVS